MRGKVVSYDSQKGIGKIFIKNQGVKLFKIENWIDYDKTPEVGLEIEFDFDENELKNISPINYAEKLTDSLNKTFEYTLPENLNIKENVSLNYCMEEFFGKFKKIALKYKYLLSSGKTIPYKKIKRFILTAYNNLLEIDIEVSDQKLKDVKNALTEIEYYYDTLKREVKNPIYVILERLVLTKQKNYMVLKNRFENNKTLITDSTKNANLLEIKINTLNKEISQLSPKTVEYNDKVILLKSYKKRYVDLIDMIQNLKEENSSIVDDIKLFENVYKDIFEKFFNQEVNLISNILLKELNALAYQFDTILWENARNSKQIQNFFKKAKIEGSYSTKTFIKYYLKNLKSDKMNIKDSELAEIFAELKVFNKNIIILDYDRNRALEISLMIENLDHDSNVKIFSDLKQFILYIKDNDSLIDLIIIEAIKYKSNIEKILNILTKAGIEIIFFSDKEENGIIDIKSLHKKLKLLI